jgi:hypothetical protein
MKMTSVKIKLQKNGKTEEHEEIELKSTLRAAQNISAQFGGFANAVSRLTSFELEAATIIIRHGAGWKNDDKKVEELPERVWVTGLSNLVAPLIRFVTILSNGGKEVGPDDMGERKVATV